MSIGREEKMQLYKRFLPQPPEELHLKTHKRIRVDSSSVYGGGLSDYTCWREGLVQKKSSRAIDYLHPSSISDVLEELDSGMYGSVTKEVGHLLSLKNQFLKDYLGLESCTSEDLRQTKQLISCDVIDVEDDCDSRSIAPLQVHSLAGPLVDEEENVNNGSSNQLREIQPSTQRDVNLEEKEENEMPNADDDALDEFWKTITDEIMEDDCDSRSIVPLQVHSLAGPLTILDSDDEEENVNNSSSNQQKGIISNQLGGKMNFEVSSLPGPLIILDSDDDDEENVNNRSSNQQKEVNSNQLGQNLAMMNFEIQPLAQRDVNQTGGHLQAEKDRGVFVGGGGAAAADDEEEEEKDENEDDDDDNDMHNADEDDGLGEFWDVITDEIKEEKKNAVEPSSAIPAAECDHSFILRDDIGSVCRVCGVIRQSIETIIEYQFTKARNTRTYPYEGHTCRDPDDADCIPGEYDAPAHDFEVAGISAHPRHRKQMKPHQIEGFNFLLRNLVTENPGGCIMAHAPGSGKTFMIISFLQSFMTKIPSARPLVILPRGILAIWKKEFLRWQVEDIPLHDLYSVRADSRAQQLQVLKRWREERSILFLGYKQFSSIVCDTGGTARQCHKILLKEPNIVILDEGHTPRNQDTDILTSLEKIETPRKVVLSGTLYQNHVKEVFNILNLVRPNFLRLDSSKEIKRRIMSKVSMYNRRDILRKGSENEFYEVVEHTLVKDKDFKRKVMVIQDLRQMTGKVLHYYKGDSLDELPGLVDFTVLLRLSPRQQRGVAELRQLNNKFKITSEGSTLYVHPQLRSLSKNAVAKDRVDVEKIDAILENLDESEGVKAKFFLNLLQLCESSGEKLLVFSQYLLPLKFLERLSMKVKGYHSGKEMFMITGDHDNDEREISMERFNSSPDARVFFGSIRACGEGISLVGASRILILDIHLNPSVTRQAIGRAFRPGQVRKVFVYRLVAGASPEEEDHLTCFKKERIARMWFEWNELNGNHDFKMETVDLNNCGDGFLETPCFREDVMCVYQR